MITDEILTSTEPVVLVLTHGETLATDVSKALEAGKQAGLNVGKINVEEKPEYGEQFQVGKHTVIAIWHCGEVASRRSRPWATDVQQMLDGAKKLVTAPAAPAKGAKDKPAAAADVPNDAPVVVTDKTFDDLVLKSKLPVLVDFWADWCGPCEMVAPILDKLAKEFAGTIRIAKVDVDANPMLSQQFHIQSIP